MDVAKLYRCNHGNDAPESLIVSLPKSQAGTARHKCAVCAFSQGRAAGLQSRQMKLSVERCQHGSTAPNTVLDILPDSQAGPRTQRHKCCVCAYSQGFDTGALTVALYAVEVADGDTLQEGAVKTVMVNAYERNPVARQRCIDHYGEKCFVCSFHFEAHYGPAGRGLIHVHHLRPLAKLRQQYEVDPIKDLRPVCPNCHAMLHRQDPPYAIEELQSMLQKAVKVKAASGN